MLGRSRGGRATWAVECAKVRELRDQGCRDDGPDPLDGTQANGLITQVVVFLDDSLHLCFDFRQAGSQGLDVLQDATPDPLILRCPQAVLLSNDHG